MANNKQILTGQQLDSSELTAAIHRVLNSYKLDDDVCLPAIVISFDRKNNVATVRPLIQIQKVDGSYQSRHPLTEINVISLGGGGFNLSFPLKEGDLGWMVAVDRDISIYKQQLTESPPNSSSPRNFAYALFIPDVMRKYMVADEDSDAVVLQSIDGNTKISVREDNIKIAATSKVLIDAPSSEFSGNLQVDGQLLVAGSSTLNGGVAAKSGTSVSLPAGTTIGGVNVSTHGHEQQNDGSGRTAGGMEA